MVRLLQQLLRQRETINRCQGDGQGERVDLGGDYDWKCNLKRSERGVSSKEEENWTRMKIETGARGG